MVFRLNLSFYEVFHCCLLPVLSVCFLCLFNFHLSHKAVYLLLLHLDIFGGLYYCFRPLLASNYKVPKSVVGGCGHLCMSLVVTAIITTFPP